jgi:hypothetical protein
LPSVRVVCESAALPLEHDNKRSLWLIVNIAKVFSATTNRLRIGVPIAEPSGVQMECAVVRQERSSLPEIQSRCARLARRRMELSRYRQEFQVITVFSGEKIGKS